MRMCTRCLTTRLSALLCVIALAGPQAFAQGTATEILGTKRGKGREQRVLRLNTGRTPMIRDWDRDFWVSPGCLQKNGAYRCMATEALKIVRTDLKPFPTLVDHGKELGAMLCEGVLESTYTTGTMENGSQLSVCRFKDGSIINCGALTSAAYANDKAVAGADAEKRSKR